jgi:hypothetical protein
MLLIHATGVVNVRIDFANVIEITSKWSGRNTNIMALCTTGEGRATTERLGDFRTTPGGEGLDGPSSLSSLETR